MEKQAAQLFKEGPSKVQLVDWFKVAKDKQAKFILVFFDNTKFFPQYAFSQEQIQELKDQFKESIFLEFLEVDERHFA